MKISNINDVLTYFVLKSKQKQSMKIAQDQHLKRYRLGIFQHWHKTLCHSVKELYKEAHFKTLPSTCHAFFAVSLCDVWYLPVSNSFLSPGIFLPITFTASLHRYCAQIRESPQSKWPPTMWLLLIVDKNKCFEIKHDISFIQLIV